MSKKAVNETLNHILRELERMSYEVWANNDEFKSSQWYDKWEQGDREAQGYSEGHSEGYCKAMNEVITLLKKEKK